MKIFAVILLSGVSIGAAHACHAQGFVLKSGEGEPLLNGIVIKASPATGIENSILVEQFRTIFQRKTMHPERPISPEEEREIESKIGGSITIK